ncbi:hypothetical protein [Streptomyces minutiscleroticus]|uniref:hypothetical protein n=1 Tax=Streptomyces minutiscleroticus TaxID=68238 RepID=UPI0033216825
MVGVEPVHGDRTVHEDLRKLAQHGPWDAVVDLVQPGHHDGSGAVTALSAATHR